ncbi:MAG: tetratricopeptide repeat protein [Desulfotomaculaceae bacterium]|nr:tetratricopeptide repeat protein [Desulfotomaculaceae bacterium]
MIKIFLGSACGEHSESEEKILNFINQFLAGIGVERQNVFIPDENTSRQEALKNLNDSDLAIFLITPYYGSLIEAKCSEDCPVDNCPMYKKEQPEEFISDLHCQFIRAIKMGKPHLTFYLKVNDGVVEAINYWKNEGHKVEAIKVRVLRQFPWLTEKDFKHYYDITGAALPFINGELQQELSPPPENTDRKGYTVKGPEDTAVILESIAREALTIYGRLAEENPEAYLPTIAMAQNNLGAFYKASGNFAGAERAYREALDILSQMAEIDEDSYLPPVAMTQNNLGILYLNQGKLKQAEQALLEARTIYIQLADKHPDDHLYLSALATTQHNLGIFYRNTGKLEDAETSFQAASRIFVQLAELNPEVYLPALARIQNTMGVFYRDIGRPTEAEGAYYEALNIYNQLAGQRPDSFLPALAGTINNIAVLYGNTGKFDEAEKSFQSALQLFEKLANENPEVYLPVLAGTRVNLGNFYCDAGKIAEAKKTYREAIIIYGGLADKDPAKYVPYVNKVKEIRKRLMAKTN